MGYNFSVDGLCIECGYFSQVSCDACGRFICVDHMHFEEIKGSKMEKHVVCHECVGKNKPKWFIFRTMQNAKFWHMDHDNFITLPRS
ncbi:MAG: hypothetical protein QXK37_02780 [Candidatus Woesearchaeota archaeon]